MSIYSKSSFQQQQCRLNSIPARCNVLGAELLSSIVIQLSTNRKNCRFERENLFLQPTLTKRAAAMEKPHAACPNACLHPSIFQLHNFPASHHHRRPLSILCIDFHLIRGTKDGSSIRKNV
jgi:hypothetical protein